VPIPSKFYMQHADFFGKKKPDTNCKKGNVSNNIITQKAVHKMLMKLAEGHKTKVCFLH
jgi:hypothetical protein